MTPDDLQTMREGQQVRIVSAYHSARGSIVELTSIKPKGAFVRCNTTWGESNEFFLAGELERIA